jgi:hypothetical protein
MSERSLDVPVQGVLGTLIVDHNGTVLDHELQVRTCHLDECKQQCLKEATM